MFICPFRGADTMTVTEGQRCAGRPGEENQLPKGIELRFIAIRMSENVTLTQELMEQKSQECDRRRKQ